MLTLVVATQVSESITAGARTLPPRRAATQPTQARSEDPTALSQYGSIGVSGSHLTLDGRVHDFVGVNAFEIGTEWGVNAGCGGMESDAQLAHLFSSLPPDSLIRFWAFQGTMTTDITTHQLNWAPVDRVFKMAAQYHQKLIVVLAGQGGTCDNMHWQDPSWYEGGFMQVYDSPSTTDGRGLTPVSYWDYMLQIVSRYKNSPALGMWEPVSEPEASTCPPSDEPLNCSGNQTCPDEAVAAQALRHFFDVVGGEIHTLDPEHLVESGTLGSGQCGLSGPDFAYVSASPGIDVLSYHDYYEATPMGGDQWNGVAVRLAQAAALGKPIIAGEVGITAGTAAGCTTLPMRSAEMNAKMRAQFQAGASAFLVWDWVPAPTSSCSYDTFPGDPLMTLLGTGTS